jgi:hypothetical protein
MKRAAFLAGILMALAHGQAATPQVPSAAPAQSKPAPARLKGDINLPPLSYVCPMAGDEDVIEDKPGVCRKCGMQLQPVRLDTVWTCLTNTSYTSDRPGECPTDGRPLVPMTMSVSWGCPGLPDAKLAKPSLTPGTCPDGTPMQRQYAPRPHGNHNPQHGGGFFMAPDNWHHLEGGYYAPGVFRLYLYDDFTRPLPRAQAREATARVIVSPDSGSKEFPLVLSRRAGSNDTYFEARIGKLPFPATMQAKVTFQPATPERLFDFTFEKYSKDLPPVPVTTRNAAPPASPVAAPSVPGAPAATPAAATPAATPATGDALSLTGASPGASGIDAALVPVPIPDTVPEMLAQLQTRNTQIKMLIDRGAFASVYVPAFQAKDVALALDGKKGDLSPDRQRMVGPAVNRLVRTAYLLDAFGDLGNKQQISDAYAEFAGAVRDIETAFPQQP